MKTEKKRKRRIRSPYPGVVLKRRILPGGGISWRARFVDPDTGKETYVTLDAFAANSEHTRRKWAIDKSKALAQRAREIANGAPRFEATAIETLVADYRKAAARRLRPRTLSTYGQAERIFTEWAKKEGVTQNSQLTRVELAALRAFILAKPRRAVRRGGKRGERISVDDRVLAAVSINRVLRSIKTMIGTWRFAGQLPAGVDRDLLADTFKAEPEPKELPDFLTPSQLAKLIEAAQRHDADAFDETRAEHEGQRLKGTTRKHPPILPFLLFVLLTGCRRGEALGLLWQSVDLDALDNQGNRVGEIRLRAGATKTHHARIIGLEVSPALRALLAQMRLRAGSDAEGLAVFGGRRPYTGDLVDAALGRLRDDYGAPSIFTWQVLRSTCATYLTNAPGIFGAASAYHSAKQLGHSTEIAEKHYAGVVRGIPRDARTLEAAMQIEASIKKALSDSSTPTLRALRAPARRARSGGNRQQPAQRE